MKALWAGCLGLSVVLLSADARGDEIQWKPASSRRPAAPAAAKASGDADRPVATLGIPVPTADSKATLTPVFDRNLTRTNYSSETTAAYTVRAQGPDGSGPTLGPPPGVNAVPASPAEQYNCGVVNDPPPAGGTNFFGKCKHWFDGFQVGGKTADRGLFQSVHTPEMDQFASPVSDPFLFEDPRALTELRPILMYQATPGNQYVFHGGDILWIGTQARVALTERLSLVMNKFGGIWQEPHNHILGFNDHAGFSEVWIGPKYTFYRCDETRTVAAAGLTFQIPAGSNNTFQNTGTLGLTPYVTAAQNFLRSSYGSFNVMDTFGYNFATDNKRTEYIYNSLHLDYNVLNANKIYPLIEMSYLNDTRAGAANAFGFEGRDLYNFGSTGVSGRNSLTISTGARYKFNECVQTGFTIGTPLVAPRDLYGYRLTWDFIFRY